MVWQLSIPYNKAHNLSCCGPKQEHVQRMRPCEVQHQQRCQLTSLGRWQTSSASTSQCTLGQRLPAQFQSLDRSAATSCRNSPEVRLPVLQEEAERSATSVAETPASMPTGKSGQLGHQLSFDITAHAGPALASPAPEPRQEHCQPVPATPEASAHMHSHAVVALSPTDVLFASWKILVEPSKLPTAQHSAMWKRMAVPARAHSAQQGLISHPICCDSDSE